MTNIQQWSNQVLVNKMAIGKTESENSDDFELSPYDRMWVILFIQSGNSHCICHNKFKKLRLSASLSRCENDPNLIMEISENWKHTYTEP